LLVIDRDEARALLGREFQMRFVWLVDEEILEDLDDDWDKAKRGGESGIG